MPANTRTLPMPFANSTFVSLQKVVFVIISLLVSAGVFWYLSQTISLAELQQIIARVPPAGFAIFLLFSLMMSSFRCWRDLLLLRISGFNVAVTPLFLITLVRNFFSDLLPARLGTLVFIYLARTRLSVSWSSASACFAYSFIFDMISLGFLILLATFAAAGITSQPAALMAAGLFFAALSTGVLFALPKLLHIAIRLLQALPLISPGWRRKLQAAASSLHDELMHLQRSGMYLPILVLSLGVRAGKYLALYALLLSLVLPLGYGFAEMPLPRVFFGLTAAELAASLPISGIAGFGAYEGAWSLVFQLLGYPEKLAALTSVSHHLLTQLYGYSLGAIAFLLLLLPWRRQSSEPQSVRRGGVLFYLRAAVLLLAPLCLAAFAVLTLPSLQPAHGTTGAVHQITAPPAIPAGPPPGSVVFQRPNGIFTADSQSRQEKQLTTSGSNPRWSPDGRLIAFIDGTTIRLMQADGSGVRTLAQGGRPKAVVFRPDGKAVLYADGQQIREIDLSGGISQTVYSGSELFELDASPDGKLLVATEKKLGGYRVIAIALPEGTARTIARGCSASISADGQLISVNGSSHQELFIYSRSTGEKMQILQMIAGKKFDNQCWSNHPEWLASRSEGDDEQIYLHHLPSGAAFAVTSSGAGDRPDYFVSGAKKPAGR